MKYKFEWDEVKNKANLAKHGISFEVAASALEKNPYLARQSKNSGNDDVRYQAITKYEDKYYTIIYTIRDSKVRIISARRSRNQEKREYDKRF